MPVNATDPRLVVEVWSDFMCPFCYMGHTLLGTALEHFPHAGSVEVWYRSYQLMPDLPRDEAVGANELLVREKGLPPARVAAMNAEIAERGRTLGIDYHFERVLAVNTRLAHRLAHFARSEGRQADVVGRLFRAYFTEGLHLGRPEVLVELAADAGLDPVAVRDALEDYRLEAAVQEDQHRARELGIAAVPFFLFGGAGTVQGAHPEPVLTRALEQAWARSGS